MKSSRQKPCSKAITFTGTTIDQLLHAPTAEQKEHIQRVTERVMAECASKLELSTRYVFDGRDTTFIAEVKQEANVDDGSGMTDFLGGVGEGHY